MIKINYSMEKSYFILIILLLSCQHEKIISVYQVPSDEKVQLFFDEDLNNDSINICLPIEYKLIKGQNDIYSFGVIFISNKKDLEENRDFRLYDKANHKLLYATVELNPNEIPEHLIITENDIRISKKEAQKLLVKYKINKDVYKIRVADTINLISYDKFKRENLFLIKRLKKLNDSIIFRVRDGKKTKSIIIAKKIDWL